MYINAQSWHARVYRFWYAMKHGQWSTPGAVNLCPYVRAVVFWSWSRWLMRSGKIQMGGLVVGVPWLFWGCQPLLALWLDYYFLGRQKFIFTLTIFGMALAILSGASLVVFLGYLIRQAFRTQPAAQAGAAIGHVIDNGMSFGRVVMEYIHGAHNKICPVVEFKESAGEQQ